MRQSTSLLTLMAALSLPVAAVAQPNSAGAQIATSGGGNGVTACVSCHGAQGEGNAAAGFPRLAGQSQAYLAHQLTSYANGSRNNPIMMPIAKGMSAQQIEAVAAYYAGLSAPTAKAAAPNAQEQKRGEQLATIGDGKIGVQSCANCHGPGGSGEPPTYPYLSGQHSSYLKSALSEWKSGARNTDPSQQMNIIAKRLSDQDIATLADYFAAQPAPGPEQHNVAAGQKPAQPTTSGSSQTTPSSRSSSGAAGAKGAGVEQGEPTSGSQQGPGGGGGGSGAGPSGSKTGVAK